MKQLVQNLRTGETLLLEVPAPMVRKGCVLIQTHKSLISSGTERMLLNFGKASLLQKARLQPAQVKQAIDKIRSNGFFPTIQKIYHKLDQLLPLGYCNVGHVLEVGDGVHDIQVGDRVVSNGPHAEIICVPRNLVAKVPENVFDEAAVFTVIGAVALNAVRLISPGLGETVVVMGLGLVGLMTADLLKINGCQVIGIDPDDNRRAIAAAKGFISIDPETVDPEKYIAQITSEIGADAVIIASTSQSHQVVAQAAAMSRKRGKIVLIGTADLQLDRAAFYHKELTFQVASSYGPGRYDAQYEQHGMDYPLPYVRWTENRNFQAILQLLSSGVLDPTYLISDRVDLEDYKTAYAKLQASETIAILLYYAVKPSTSRSVQMLSKSFTGSKGVIGIIGAGHFTAMTMLPLLKDQCIKCIASAKGLSSTHLARKHGIPFATTDYQTILDDPEVDLVMITTRHDLHASITIQALEAGKHVFVEKPITLNQQDLTHLINTLHQQTKKTKTQTPTLTVGFNRRQSPHAQKMKALLGQSVMNVVITVNAGFVPKSAWIHDRAIGGGRILGEGCHLMDLIIYLTGSLITAVCLNAMDLDPSETTDNASILIKCANGSTGVVNYFSNGHSAYPKERIEVYSLGRTLILDDFKTLTGFGFKGFSKSKSAQNKGHKEAFAALMHAVKNGGESVIPFHEIVNSAAASLAALESLKQKAWINI
ncbi:bi-domain-containing oxidoreductase [Dyadobacter sp. CY347]|uniref:bi-domain-containing oxidoreductase n=1 Tax=Dyadobacter sp. CY347 TaxID=2909336 RepID=UPI001F36656B|nr:bi-domain-containing oxidoreductase [Dyadobacter sp. CY347]MCF2489722.1 bi-domain-containing oxidoreductase [Dyadobacter sp. CY347]